MRMNKFVRTSIRKTLIHWLDRGEFPEVGWTRGECYEYNTLAFIKLQGRLAFLVGQALRTQGYPPVSYTHLTLPTILLV